MLPHNAMTCSVRSHAALQHQIDDKFWEIFVTKKQYHQPLGSQAILLFGDQMNVLSISEASQFKAKPQCPNSTFIFTWIYLIGSKHTQVIKPLPYKGVTHHRNSGKHNKTEHHKNFECA